MELSDRWLESAASLRASGTPFVLATIVAREAPQSVRVGAHAVVLADGRVEGWIGGGCIRPTVVREARAALAEGRPRLVRMSPGAAPDPRPDVRVYPLTCQGEGAVDVYLEPVVPVPVLVVLGTSPVARALAELAPAIGLVPALHDVNALPPGDAGIAELAGRVRAAGASPAVRYVVVATMGEADEEALEAAVVVESAYIGLVSSRKKAESLFAYLRGRGLPDEVARRVKAPAGLDLGAATPAEIALSVLAEVIERRRHGAVPAPEPEDTGPTLGLVVLGGPVESPAPAATSMPMLGQSARVATSPTAIDPVCGMTVDVAGARHVLTLPDGRSFYFCSPRCRAAVEQEPARYLAPVG